MKAQASIIKTLDAMWASIIKEIYRGKCAICGREGSQAHHFFPKGGHSAVRWHVHNGVYCCFGCHIRQIHQAGNTEPARDALISRIGLQKFAALKELAYQVCKRRKADYEAIRRELILYSDPDMIEALRNENEKC
jgi:hypothetical protein